MKALDPRYRKYGLALLGVFGQLVAVMLTASDAGALPESWRPWVVVAVAVATALGVRTVPNDPLDPAPVDPGSPNDDGGYRPHAVLVVAVLAILGLVGVLVAADDADAKTRPLEHVRVASVTDCNGVLEVAFNLEKPRVGRRLTVWEFLQEDGAAAVQIHEVGAYAGPGGRWADVPSTSRGDGHRRVPIAGRPTWDLVRVVHHGVASSGVLVEGGCPNE